ncbi:dipeptidyl peptidase IV [Paraglaciecola mesophila KMM 241]|uniref:Dipeptidyl peptidase IV n=1 Tax=Paraglaciecola mesophila KMM 241 TaxID=1128912 RepID=K6YW59_9ALTE|nr:prolyl oligopeptidase family serine peptidase [Paraglaciecola mesophila]GAC22397.1 dipeptidyl peptidase IV [Paraglaciecola mesophila KMM 241]
MYNFSKTLLAVLIATSVFACSTTYTTDTQPQPIINKSDAEPPVANKALIEPSPSTIASKHATPGDNTLTLEQIMADPDWIGRQPLISYWGDDSQSVFYTRKAQGSPVTQLWQLHSGTLSQGKSADEAKKVELAQLHNVSDGNRVTNLQGTYSAWVFEGNIFIKSLSGSGQHHVRQLTQDGDGPRQIQFLTDGRLAYQRGNNLISLDPSNGFSQKLATWEFSEAPVANEKPADYIAEQQIALIDYVAKKRSERQAKFAQQAALAKQNSTLAPEAFYFSNGDELVSASVSPNGKWALLATTVTQKTRSDDDLMPAYIGEDGRIERKEVRQRVADAKPVNHQLWLLDLTTHKKHALSYQSLPGYNEDVLAEVKRENAEAAGKSYQTNRLPRDIVLMSDWSWTQGAIQWHESGEQVAIMVEAWDNKDRWLATVDLKKHSLVNQERLHDDAWINYRFNSFGWLHNSEQLYYLSEKSGYAHLYVKPLNANATALTSGRFEVNDLTLTKSDEYLYYKANQKHPGIYEIYRVNINSGKIEALTDLNGMTDYALSPDESKLLLTHSTLTMPPELYVQNATPGAPVTRLTHTISEAFLAMGFAAPDIVPVKSSHTTQPIFSRVYQPAGNASNESAGNEKRRAVIFNHGAGYLQNSHLGWSGYFREFMFHNMLAQQGYVVMDMDYRASAGYGRDWRTAIYRHMGKPEIDDLRDGINWLVENANVDRERIGTYGGSYGGFMTFMALFTQPDLFQSGAALRPVTDWAHYNHGYTSNILNMPGVDPIAYERSSPLYFAEGLEKPLLINAPMVDSNVFFQDTVRLVQRLIELEKQNFETAIYPVESHGFVQPSSWLDEYRRIYKLFETTL